MSANRDDRLVSYVERTAIWIPTVVIGFLFLPMVVTHRSFGPDWTLHLWAVRQQQWSIEAMGHPGLFLSAKPFGAFYPIFAFLGSGSYAVGGYLAIVLGPIVAYKFLYLVGLCLAYGGFTWLSVQFGLRGWRSQVPGAVLVTGAYFITDMVGRGDFGEFIAVASIPFVVAAICAVVTLPRVRLRHRLAVVLGVFVLTGSHNITLLWGSMFVALLGILAALAWGPRWRRPLPWRRLGQLVGLGVIGACLNAWFLFPDLAYGLDTAVARQSRLIVPVTNHVDLGGLLNPLRPADHVSGVALSDYVRLSLPVLFFAWAVVVALTMWRQWDSVAKRLFVALVGLVGVFTCLLTVRSMWKPLPQILYNIQFTYRIDSYVLLTTALLVMIALHWQARAHEPARRWTSVVLAAILVFNVGAATRQVWSARSIYFWSCCVLRTGRDFADHVVESRYEQVSSSNSIGYFRDISSPVIAVAIGRTMTVPLTKIHGSSFSGTLDVPDGPGPFTTNISAGPRFVRMTGIKAVGRTPDGFIVAVRAASPLAAGPVPVTIRQADTAPLRAGAIVSLLSALALLALIVWPARVIARRRPVAGSEPSQ